MGHDEPGRTKHRLFYNGAMAEHRTEPLLAGEHARDFELKASPDQPVSLSDFRDRALIVASYPADWSPCVNPGADGILAALEQLQPELEGVRS